MVAGADTLLEKIANGKSEVTLLISEDYFPTMGFAVARTNDHGDYIVADTTAGHNHLKMHELWLCSVTTFVFGYYPNTLYLQILNVDHVTTPVEHKTTVKGWFKWLWSYFKFKLQ
jgi:hypothetical protein